MGFENVASYLAWATHVVQTNAVLVFGILIMLAVALLDNVQNVSHFRK